MTKTWKIKFVNDEAKDEVFSLSPDLRAKFVHITDLLISFGPHDVGLPHIRSLENKLWEIRLKGKDNIARSVYILASSRRIMILHTFIKKTEKTPKKNLKIAYRRLQEVQDE